MTDLEQILNEEHARTLGTLSDDPSVVEDHVETHTFTEVEIYPEHEQRSTSAEFTKNRKLLVKDHGCWICGSRDNLEVHHYLVEWSLWDAVKAEQLITMAQTFDVYGYGKQLKDTVFKSPDDIRNLMVLCKDHHRTPGLGVHTMTFPIWIVQRYDKPGQEVAVALSRYQQVKQKVQAGWKKIKKPKST